jgi:plasmid stabilization system protein ParE
LKRLRLTSIARRDLDEIWDGIAGDDISAADRVIDGIYEILSKLREFPSMGAPRTEFRPGTRSFVYKKKYLVFYSTKDDAVIVLRVIYGGRDLRSLELPTT